MGKAFRIAAILGCAVLVLAAAPALAKKKHHKSAKLGALVTRIGTAGEVVSAGQVSTPSATCPSGSKIVSGGFSAPFVPGAQMVVIASRRTSDTTWSVSAISTGGGGEVLAYAYCRTGTHPISDVATTTVVPGGAGANVIANTTCPPGTFAISGGFESTRGPNAADFVQPMDSTGDTTSWGGFYRNNGAAPQTATTHAYCMGGIKPPAERQDQIQLSQPVFGSVSESSACLSSLKLTKKTKKGRRKLLHALSGGGFLTSFPPAGPALPVHVESHIAAGGVWLDRVVNGGTGAGIIPAQSASVCY
jgi:hypothetical protein